MKNITPALRYGTNNRALVRRFRDGRPLSRDSRVPIFRDAMTGPTANTVGRPVDLSSFGWLGASITGMANTQRWAFALTDGTTLITAAGFPIRLMAQSPVDLVDQLRIQAIGSASKFVGSLVLVAPTAATQTVAAAATAVRSFGVKIRIANSPVNLKFGTYQMTLVDAGAANAVIATIFVEPTRTPVDIIVLGISDAGGVATPFSIINPAIQLLTPNAFAWQTGDTVSFETLNMRDLGELILPQ